MRKLPSAEATAQAAAAGPRRQQRGGTLRATRARTDLWHRSVSASGSEAQPLAYAQREGWARSLAQRVRHYRPSEPLSLWSATNCAQAPVSNSCSFRYAMNAADFHPPA